MTLGHTKKGTRWPPSPDISFGPPERTVGSVVTFEIGLNSSIFNMIWDRPISFTIHERAIVTGVNDERLHRYPLRPLHQVLAQQSNLPERCIQCVDQGRLFLETRVRQYWFMRSRQWENTRRMAFFFWYQFICLKVFSKRTSRQFVIGGWNRVHLCEDRQETFAGHLSSVDQLSCALQQT